MSFQITATYAALLGLLFVAMSIYVTVTRNRTGVSTGDGGNIAMIVAMRRQGNMAEYTPFALLLMAIAEAGGLGAAWVHGVGLALLAGRLIHPFGIGEAGGNFPARVIGQTATWAAIAVTAIGILWAGVA